MHVQWGQRLQDLPVVWSSPVSAGAASLPWAWVEALCRTGPRAQSCEKQREGGHHTMTRKHAETLKGEGGKNQAEFKYPAMGKRSLHPVR